MTRPRPLDMLRTPQAIVTAVWAVTRLPWLGPGLGTDLDGWRIVHTARQLLETGSYAPSRPPGYPVAAAVHVVAEWLGGGASAAHTAIPAIASLVLGLLVLRVSDSVIAALAVLLHPLIAIHSTTAMDYVPAASLVFAARAVAARSDALTGLLGGLAAGYRPATGPALVLSRSWRAAAIWLIVAALAWLPAAVVLGTRAFHAGVPVSIRPAVVAYRTIQQVTGVLGAVVFIAALLYGRRAPGDRRPVLRDLATALALALPWIVFPLDPAYLIPAIPFATLVLAAALRPAWFAAVAIAVVSNSVVSFGVVDRTIYRETGHLSIESVAPGLVLRTRTERLRMRDDAERIAEAKLPPRAVVLVDLPPVAVVEARPDRWSLVEFDLATDRDGHLVVLDPTQQRVRAWRDRGRPLVWLRGRGIRYRLRRIENYDPASLGGRPLGDGASAEAGGP